MSEWDARGHTPHTRVRGTPIAYIIPGKDELALLPTSAYNTHDVHKVVKAMDLSERDLQKLLNCLQLKHWSPISRHGLLRPLPRPNAGDAASVCQHQRQPRHGDCPGPGWEGKRRLHDKEIVT